MTIGTPARAGLALASYERPVGVNPPLDYPAYRSTALRAPRRPLQVMPQGLTEVTGPLLAQPGPPAGFRFDIHLQGDQETVFFDV